MSFASDFKKLKIQKVKDIFLNKTQPTREAKATTNDNNSVGK